MTSVQGLSRGRVIDTAGEQQRLSVQFKGAYTFFCLPEGSLKDLGQGDSMRFLF